MSTDLQQTQAIFKAISSYGPALIWVSRAEGTYSYFNEVWSRFNWRETIEREKEGATLDIHPDDLKRYSDMNRIAHETQADFEIEYRLRKWDGGFAWIQEKAIAQKTEEGKFNGFVRVGIEITERKNIEENLKVRIEQSGFIENLQDKIINASKMATLGEMAASIAHEINNPLTLVIGRIETIRMKTDHIKEVNVREDLEQNLNKMEGLVIRVGNIIRGLKSFSRNGASDPLEYVELKSILNETLELCQERFKNNKVDLICSEIPDQLLNCRAVQISQVILNMLNNAFDAIQSLPEKWVKLDFEATTEQIQIRITDSGKGIPEEIAKRLMEPFFTTKQVGKGTGLGLSIARKILQDHQGELILDRASKNTSFVIVLPKAVIDLKSAA